MIPLFCQQIILFCDYTPLIISNRQDTLNNMQQKVNVSTIVVLISAFTPYSFLPSMFNLVGEELYVEEDVPFWLATSVCDKANVAIEGPGTETCCSSVLKGFGAGKMDTRVGGMGKLSDDASVVKALEVTPSWPYWWDFDACHGYVDVWNDRIFFLGNEKCRRYLDSRLEAANEMKWTMFSKSSII